MLFAIVFKTKYAKYVLLDIISTHLEDARQLTTLVNLLIRLMDNVLIVTEDIF